MSKQVRRAERDVLRTLQCHSISLLASPLRMRRTGSLLSSQMRPVTGKRDDDVSARVCDPEPPVIGILTIVTVTELVRETVALLVDEKTADAAQRLGSQELDLGVRLVRVDETSRVNLDFVEVDTVRANLKGHLGTVTLAVLAVRGRQVEKLRAVLGEQSVLRKICRVPPLIMKVVTVSDDSGNARAKWRRRREEFEVN